MRYIDPFSGEFNRVTFAVNWLTRPVLRDYLIARFNYMRFLFIVSALRFLGEASPVAATNQPETGSVKTAGSNSSITRADNKIQLDYPREFGYRAPGNIFFNSMKPLSRVQKDWFCTLKFDPVNAWKISSPNSPGLAQKALDQLNDSQIREGLKAVLTKKMRGEFCIDTPPPIKDNKILLSAARLTRSQHKDQATLHCTYSDVVAGSDNKDLRVASYTIPDKYSSDLLKQEKYNIGMTTDAMAVHKPKNYDLTLKKVEDHYDKHADITDPDSLYGAELWCTAIAEKRKEVEDILFAFLKTPVAGAQSSPVQFLGGPLDIIYSHGARFGKANNQCSITFFGRWSEEEGLASRYETLVSMNHQGLCFGGPSLDEVVPAPSSVKLAWLEKDTHSENPVLKCFERVQPPNRTGEGNGQREISEEEIPQIFAEYRLPFKYHAFDPLKQTPITIKPAVPTKKGGDGNPNSTPEESNAQAGDSDKADSARGGIFGRAFLSGSTSSKMASMGNYMSGKDSRGGIEFIDKYNDPFSGTDKTNASGFMAQQYCSHLMYMKNVFEALNLTEENIKSVKRIVASSFTDGVLKRGLELRLEKK